MFMKVLDMQERAFWGEVVPENPHSLLPVPVPLANGQDPVGGEGTTSTGALRVALQPEKFFE